MQLRCTQSYSSGKMSTTGLTVRRAYQRPHQPIRMARSDSLFPHSPIFPFLLVRAHTFPPRPKCEAAPHSPIYFFFLLMATGSILDSLLPMFVDRQAADKLDRQYLGCRRGFPLVTRLPICMAHHRITVHGSLPPPDFDYH
jgi:hypothetical protein